MSPKKTLLVGFLLLGITLIGSTQEARAVGALFGRPLRSTSSYRIIDIKTVDATVTIQGRIAVTHVDQVFHNTSSYQVEAIFAFPLPRGAVITELIYWFNGKRYVAQIREKWEAIRRYQQQIRRYLDPALLQYLGDNLFRLNIAPINPNSDVRFEITYVELLDYDFGKISYRFFLNTTGLSPSPLQRVSVQLDAVSPSPFKYFRSPTHQQSTATSITQISDREYRLVFGDENFMPDRDLIVEFETIREGIDLNVYTYTPVPADSFGTDSFFTLSITPPDSLLPQALIPKAVVFVADVSSSMEGERLQQLKEALRQFLQRLSPEDYFNIVAFGTTVVSFSSDLVRATPDNLNGATAFVNGLSAFGLTNIEGALRTALNMSFTDSTANILIFLTDGYPTWGIMDTSQLVALVQELNQKDVRIFSFGIGDEVAKVLLRTISRENHGYAVFITAADSIAEVVNYHFERLSRPVLMDLEITISGLAVYDVYPRDLPDLFWGSQVLIFGRYTNAGTFPVQLRGRVRGETVEVSQEASFPDTAGGFRAVARLWANSKIQDLLEQIAIYGELPELVDAVIQLSLQFQILTPYTAFYAEPPGPGTGVESEFSDKPFVPETFSLYQNYPNPFNSWTQIVFDVPASETPHRVLIQIFDVRGRLIRTLVDREFSPGRHRVIWDGTDSAGRKVPSGIYICTLRAGKIRLSRKILLVR